MPLQSSSIYDMHSFLNNKYYIPNYQREYSWENDELEDFWNDLKFTKDEEDDIHFFGQIVVHDDSDQKKKFIIDGQQRATTSMIFLRAMQINYDELFEEFGQDEARYQSSDIESNYLGRKQKRHLNLGDLDNDEFEKILSNKPDIESKKRKKSHEHLRKAYIFFDTKIREDLKNAADCEDKLNILLSYSSTFLERFKVLYMEATKLEEAFVIFETLNARGKDLETADLLKNYILNHSGEIDTSLKKWNSMIGKLDKCDPTKYIRNFWNATQSFTREKALYRAINKSITVPRKTKELLNDLDELSLYYHDMVVPSESSLFDDDLKRIFLALKTLKASSFYPVVLAMKKQNYNDNDLCDVLKKIECYVFRNFTICGKTANSAETYFAEIAKSIFDENLKDIDVICTEIKKGIVSDDEFKEAFKRWSGTKSSKETIRYILRNIHKHLGPSNELNFDNTEVHIEHIMSEDNSKWNVDEDFHESYLWRLGNLCLLSGLYNQSISNKVFLEKRSIYRESKIEPNKDIANNDHWDAQTIDQRQEKFADYALEIWKK